MTPLTVRFHLQPKDVRALSRHAQLSPQSLWAIVAAFVVFAALVGIFSALYQRQLALDFAARRPSTWVPLALGAQFVSFFGFLGFLLWLQKPLVRQLRGFNTRTQSTIALSDEGVLHRSNGGETETSWRAVRKVGATKNHVFLWAPSERVFIIPRRAFASAEEFAAFCDFARRRWQAHQPEVPPIAAV